MGKVIEKSEKNFTYRGKIVEMPNRRQRNKANRLDGAATSTTSQNGNNNYRPTNRLYEFLNNNFGAALVAGLLLFYLRDLPTDIAEIKTNIAVMDTKIQYLDSNYTLLNSQVWSNKSNSANASKVNNYDLYNSTDILVASESFSYGTANMYSSGDNVLKSSGSLDYIQSGEVIGTRVGSETEITKESLENRPFIIEYEENGEDVFFYGKYNENNRWDGDCIVNRYINSQLSSIMEAKFDDGELIHYRQVFKGENNLEQKVWYVSDRYVDGNKNSGETKTYFFYGDYEKELDIETITDNDIMDVDKFCETIPSTIEGYYNGYTSNGRYNDNSGHAYLVKYKPDGNVRYLYVGRMKDGVPDDDSGNAWLIAWGDANDGYHYYQGRFYNGTQESKPKSWMKPMTREQIEEIVNPDYFNCSLQGLLDENT